MRVSIFRSFIRRKKSAHYTRVNTVHFFLMAFHKKSMEGPENRSHSFIKIYPNSFESSGAHVVVNSLVILYLPMYIARPCIKCAPIFDCTVKKKKKQET